MLAEKCAAKVGKRIRALRRSIRHARRNKRNRSAKAEIHKQHTHEKQRRIIENKQYTYRRIPKITSEEIRKEREDRYKRCLESIKDEEVTYPEEIDKCLAEIRYRDNHIEPPKTIIK